MLLLGQNNYSQFLYADLTMGAIHHDYSSPFLFPHLAPMHEKKLSVFLAFSLSWKFSGGSVDDHDRENMD
jgi:hypothetical protein